MNIKWIFWSLFLLMGPFLPAQDTTHRFDVGEKPQLILKNMSGEINIKSGKSGQVTITVLRVADPKDVEITQNGDRIRVKTRSGAGNKRSYRGASFEIEFPEKGELEISTLSGDVTVKGVSGYLRLRSVSGDIEVKRLSGRLALHSVSGDVSMTETGACEVDAVSMSGDISYSRGSLVGGDYSFSSTSGNVLVAYEQEASFSLSGRTISGTITDRSGAFKITRAEYSNITSVKGSVGSGDVRVQANSVSGNIRIRLE